MDPQVPLLYYMRDAAYRLKPCADLQSFLRTKAFARHRLRRASSPRTRTGRIAFETAEGLIETCRFAVCLGKAKHEAHNYQFMNMDRLTNMNTEYPQKGNDPSSFSAFESSIKSRAVKTRARPRPQARSFTSSTKRPRCGTSLGSHSTLPPPRPPWQHPNVGQYTSPMEQVSHRSR